MKSASAAVQISLPSPDDVAFLHERTLAWFDEHERPLPWRAPGTSPWGVFLSEMMSHQTPVARVAPIWQEWIQRWPAPADLAAVPESEAVRAWGRLGYPRRARYLHAAAVVMVEDYDGQVPRTEEELLALPGVGPYTAAAVAAFAYGQHTVVVDTNIRRVNARYASGRALAEPALTRAESTLAAALLPAPALSARYNAAIMEIGALVCTAKNPSCEQCPLLQRCAWVAAGRPEAHYAPKGQKWAGTDRQVRGAIVEVLRQHEDGLGPVDVAAAARAALRPEPEPEQLQRCLANLLAEGMIREESGLLHL